MMVVVQGLGNPAIQLHWRTVTGRSTVKRFMLVLLALLASGCAQLRSDLHTTLKDDGSFDGAGYPVKVCDAYYSGRPANCSLTGTGDTQIIRGNVISDGRLYVGGGLLIGSDGRITAVGCHLPQVPGVTLDCPGSLVSAGFINLHEHIDYSYQQPLHPPTLKWVHRNEWRKLSPAERGFEGDAPKDHRLVSVGYQGILVPRPVVRTRGHHEQPQMRDYVCLMTTRSEVFGRQRISDGPGKRRHG